MHGGKRSGAGRKKGSLSTRTQEIVARAAADGLTPLEYMLGILRDETQDAKERFAAAKECAPYMHPRLAAVEHSGDKENPVVMEHREGADAFARRVAGLASRSTEGSGVGESEH